MNSMLKQYEKQEQKNKANVGRSKLDILAFNTFTVSASTCKTH